MSTLRGRLLVSHANLSGSAGAALLALSLIIMVPMAANAAQRYACSVDVAVGTATRVNLPVEAPVDLTAYLAGIGGTLDPGAFQVVEVDSNGAVVGSAVPFQFDPAPGFDPVTNAAGDLVFVANDTTPALASRHYRVLFDVVGACVDCPPPPAPTAPTTVDTLQYEGQLTYLVSTPRADYYYHAEGGGLAAIIDHDGNDWLGYHATPGSGERGEYRGIPNMDVSVPDISNGSFHAGDHSATTTLVNHGPLKVTLRSVYDNPLYRWSLLWEFYPDYVRMTVEEAGPDNGGNYWVLYEGTPGGSLDTGDIVVRSDGFIGSAAYNSDQWETVLADPQWLYYRDTTNTRYLFLSDDNGDNYPDAHRSMGYIDGGPNSGMVVYGFGRVADADPEPLRPRMYGANRTFTFGLGEDDVTAAADIAGSTLPFAVTVGMPTDQASAVGDLPSHGAVLGHNNPNPFNPATTISFTIGERGPVNLSVFDVAGRLVRTLVNADLEPGLHAATWDGQDRSGRLAASGTYLYRLTTGGKVLAGKMTLVE